MSEEDARTLWCGNLSEKVSEEFLYELFVQAGPVEMVKIPRDNDKRQRSYAFITYGHVASVEYAMNIFEGTKLFQRPLTLHKKSKNGPNPSASPKVNFNSNQPQNRGQHNQQQQQQQQQNQHQKGGQDGNSSDRGQFSMANMSPTAVNQMMANMKGMIDQMNQQALAGLGQMQQNHLQNKMNRNDRQHQQQKPYSRDRGGDNQLYSRDRNDGQMYSRDRGGNGRGRGGGGGGGNQRRNDYRGRK